MNHIISGLFSGNAVVGKVSEHTSWSAHSYYARLVAKALEVHGHSPDLCPLITGFGDAGAALVADPCVDKIIFTGSPGIGKKVMSAAADYGKPVILELGGKDPMVVMDDCRLQDVYPWVLRGVFQNCGQNCVGVERVFLYEGVYEQFLKDLVPKVKAMRQGAPIVVENGVDKPASVDCASMVMKEQLDIVQSLIDDAVKKGARVLCGGKRSSSQSTKQFYEPTIVADVTPEMRIFHEELFGPVLTVIRVAGNSDAACLEMVNNCEFGLGASVYCGDQARGLSLGRRIRSGMCCINDFGSNYLVQSMPFGGVGESGFGRFAGPEGLRALCLERSILFDRIPGVRTTIPDQMQYPIDPVRSFRFADSLIQLMYSETWIEKVKAIFGLV